MIAGSRSAAPQRQGEQVGGRTVVLARTQQPADVALAGRIVRHQRGGPTGPW